MRHPCIRGPIIPTALIHPDSSSQSLVLAVEDWLGVHLEELRA